MLVKELREALKDMPGEMNVYAVGGHGIASAKHIFKGNLVDVEQFCELRTYFEDHTPQFLDSKIERETGFANRDELIAAYLKLHASAIEARQGGDGEAGSVHESAAPKADAQPSSEPTP